MTPSKKEKDSAASAKETEDQAWFPKTPKIQPIDLHVPKASAEGVGPSKDGQRLPSDEWEFINLDPTEAEKSIKEGKQPIRASRGSHEPPSQACPHVLSDKANRQTASSEPTESEGSMSKNLSPQLQPRSRASSDSEFCCSFCGRADSPYSGGVYPPPTTPRGWTWAQEEFVDTNGFIIDREEVAMSVAENVDSPYRRAAILRAATKETLHTIMEEAIEQKFNASGLLPQVPSRIFTSEEWQVLHDRLKEEAWASETTGRPFDLDAENRETGVISESMSEKLARLNRSSDGYGSASESQVLPASTAEDTDLIGRNNRERKASSLSEHQLWLESSVESILSTDSSHIPNSMRLGTVLPPKDIEHTSGPGTEKQKAAPIRGKSETNSSTASEESEDVALLIRRLAGDEPAMKPDFFEIARPQSAPTAPTGDVISATTSRPTSANFSSIQITGGSLEALEGINLDGIDERESGKGKGKEKEMTFTSTLAYRPSNRPDPSGSPGSSKNAPGGYFSRNNEIIDKKNNQKAGSQESGSSTPSNPK